MENLDLFYTYVMPLTTLFSFFYIIYLLISKRAVFKSIEKDFEESVEKNSSLSKSAIVKHFKNMQENTAEMLQNLNQEAEQHIHESIEQIETLSDQLKQITYNQQELNNRLSNLESSNEELHNEIKKRDAIIERKTRQIARLKADK